jgi:DNA-binding PucR family transcriptional regulator
MCTVHWLGYTLLVGWERPSKRVRELMRQGAKLVATKTRQEWFDELHKATLSLEYMRTVADDPLAIEAIDRSNLSNQLHWVAANISHPGEPVAANLGVESLAIARYLVRRGLDDMAVVESYRLAQNVALQSWMRVVFRLTSDPEEMRELLYVSESSITSFMGATISGIYHQMQTERNELTRGMHDERRETVALILDGATIPRQHAEKRLGYHLGQNHTAAVIWGDESNTNQSDLDRAAEALMHTVDGVRSLSVLASAVTRWVWLPGANGPDLAGVAAEVGQLPGVRIAVGPTAAGIEGFRRSHLDAITTQRMMAKLRSPRRVASFSDVELIALITADPERAERFITHTLGGFESASAELQRTVLTFIRERCNASRAAERLFIHRNTLLHRLSRANELLPQPLEDVSVQVAVALEALRWRDAGG